MAAAQHGDKFLAAILWCLLGGVVTVIAWIFCGFWASFDPVIGYERGVLNWFSHETIFFEITGAYTVAAGTLVTPKRIWPISTWINAGISAVNYELTSIATEARPWIPRPWDTDDFGFGITCGATALLFTVLGIFYYVSNRLNRVAPQI